MRQRNKAAAISVSLAIIFLMPLSSYAFQEEGGREKVPDTTKRPVRPPTDSRAKDSGRKRLPTAPPLADLTVSLTPSDARIWLNDQEIEYREPDGSLRLRGLKPGTLKIAARKTNYRDYTRTIALEPQQSEIINIVLLPLPGHISIAPSVAGAAILLTSKEQNMSFGPYTEKITNLEVPAGTYQLSVSKTGYQESVRDVDIKPAATVYLEPQLELLPVEKPAFRRSSAMSLQSFLEGKNIVVTLIGASGDSSGGRGTVEVSLPARGAGAGVVTGTLPGVPCQVEFVRLENVGDYSFSEAPAASNAWSRIVVRVRPKDSKRPVRFAINWSSILASSGAASDAGNAQSTEDAVPVQKILPNYPTAARTSRITGTVLVRVEIDERGNVTSAKATEGPSLLRGAAEDAARQWKFSPARRAGRPVRAIQTIQFNFNPQS